MGIKVRRVTGKQQRFAEEYLKDLNGKQAAIRAGYSPRSAEVRASEMLANPKIQVIIQGLMDERSTRTQVDADYVLQRLVEIDQMDVLDILNDDMSVKPVSGWPPVWRQYLAGFDLSELFEGRGDDRAMVGVLKKIKWPDKVRNLELLGKHVSINAFSERVDVNVNISLAARMAKARARAKITMTTQGDANE